VGCAAGTYASTAGLAACTLTPAGHWSAAGAVEPTPCVEGKYLPTTGATAAGQCIACGPAFVCPLGSAAQTNCPGGTYVDGDGVTCRLCVAGSFCPAGATAPVPCPPS
jgi:hypothetical protein